MYFILVSLDAITTSNCADVIDAGLYYEMNADLPSWPSDGICAALLSTVPVTSGKYVFSVSLNNYDGFSNYGNPGVLYNALDTDNYDMVSFKYV